MPHWLKFEAEWLIAGCSAPGTGGAAEFKSEAKSLQCLLPMCLNWDLRIRGLAGFRSLLPACVPEQMTAQQLYRLLFSFRHSERHMRIACAREESRLKKRFLNHNESTAEMLDHNCRHADESRDTECGDT